MTIKEPTEEMMLELKRQYVPNDGLGENHPLAALAGKYANDPYWAEVEKAIEENRRCLADGLCIACGQPLPVAIEQPLIAFSGEEDA